MGSDLPGFVGTAAYHHRCDNMEPHTLHSAHPSNTSRLLTKVESMAEGEHTQTGGIKQLSAARTQIAGQVQEDTHDIDYE